MAEANVLVQHRLALYPCYYLIILTFLRISAVFLIMLGGIQSHFFFLF